MNNPALSEVAGSSASAAALPISPASTLGVQEAPAVAASGAVESAVPCVDVPAPSAVEAPTLIRVDAPTLDLRLARSGESPSLTLVTAKPVLPLATLPKTIGLPERQRLALQALAAGNSVEDAAHLAGVSLSTLFRWRKHHPRFIAAWNAWQSESQRTARDLLVAANVYAARTVLRAAQNGDVRASLAILKGSGTLAAQTPGADIARAVKIQLDSEIQQAKTRFHGDTGTARLERAIRKQKEKQAAALVEQKRQWFERYLQIPPLPRPITSEAIARSVKEATALGLSPDACSITLTAAAGERTALVKLIVEYGHYRVPEAQALLNALPKVLTWRFISNAVEEAAKEFESLGATVELRPGWRE